MVDTVVKTHSDSLSKEKTQIPKKYNVVLHNDDKTSFEFVMMLLSTVFKKDFNESYEITHKIHNSKAGVAGTYYREVAEQKKHEADKLSSMYGFPLQITVEPE